MNKAIILIVSLYAIFFFCCKEKSRVVEEKAESGQLILEKGENLQEIEFSINENLQFKEKQKRLKEGKYLFVIDNSSNKDVNIAFYRKGNDRTKNHNYLLVLSAKAGKKESIVAELPAGEYEYFDSVNKVPKESNMLTVLPESSNNEKQEKNNS